MRAIFNTLGVSLIALATIAASPVCANLILPTGTDPSADVIFTFDFTSVTPGPPYVEVFYFATFDPTHASGAYVVDEFGDLSGGTIVTSFANSATFPLMQGLSFDPRILDGQFSLGFRATPGSRAEFADTDSFGIALVCDTAIPPHCNVVQGPDIPGRPLTTGVSEPATLALLGIGFAAITFSRRRSPST
jgi:PEP-CTERM motif